MQNQTLEGTWEEILQYAPQLSGQNVRLTILPSQPPLTLAQTLKGRVGEVSNEIRLISARKADRSERQQYLED
jgi:hypothetical protein